VLWVIPVGGVFPDFRAPLVILIMLRFRKPLPNKSGLELPQLHLGAQLVGICVGAIGAAMNCYDISLRYAKESWLTNRLQVPEYNKVAK
jgi:hypothetical protein